MENSEKMVPIGVVLTPSIIQESSIVATAEGCSRSAFIRAAVSKALGEKAGDLGRILESQEERSEDVLSTGVAFTPSLIRASSIAAALKGVSRSAFIRAAVRKALHEWGNGDDPVMESEEGKDDQS